MGEGESIPAADFVHLHVHSEFTMLDGAIRIKELVGRCEELGMPAVALTDRANMYGAVQLYHACRGTSVKPILGAEIGITAGHRSDPSVNDVGHLVLLATSQEGYQNIVRLVSLGWVEGNIDDVPRVDFELLEQYREGVIALSACMAGYLPQRILMQGPDAGREAMKRLRDVYGRDFYVELEDHGFPENRPLNGVLVDLARELDCPLVATNCCHFTERAASRAQMALQCIGASRTLRELEAMHHGSAEMYVKSAQQMKELFRDLPEATQNTMAIAERCAGAANPLADPKLPRFSVPEGQTEEAHLKDEAAKGLAQRFVEIRRQGREPDEALYRERLEVELDVINSMGFPGYFLIVADFIGWAKENDIPVGPGRGSGAGSLVAYSLGITNLDPIPYDLLFERFLNPERVSMPDFDIDFCMDKRDQVIEYVRQKYGANSVGQIATFHQLKSRSAVRDVGRVMGMAPQDAGRIATLVPEPVGGKSVPIAKAIEQEPRLAALAQEDPEVKELLDVAQQVENLTRHAGMHAAGVVISEGPIWDHVPVFCPEEGALVTQYDKNDVESAGLVKFDFLGLKTLTVIDIAVALIRKRPDQQYAQQPFDIDAIPLTDPATFALLQSGETTNVFQLESQGMQALFKELKPDCFEDIVAAVALYRPGPMSQDMHNDFVRRKHGRQKVVYPHPSLEPILADTRGVIVYQEQVMRIAQDMAGYSLGGADILRRAMGKKKQSEMEKQRAIFTAGAKERGHDPREAEQVFDLMEGFAQYGFNKSHSAAYALITYQTAYLKAHFPAEFCCATMSADKDRSEKVVRTVAEARALGITVLPPDVNQSEIDFTVVYEPVDEDADPPEPRPGRPMSERGVLHDPRKPKIRFGLGALKGVGTAALEAVFEARTTDEEGERGQLPFVDLFDFCDRVDLRRVNKGVCQALVQSGAFDGCHDPQSVHRAQAFTAIETAIERGRRAAQERASGQQSLFGLLGDEDPKAFTPRGGTFPSDVPRWDSRDQLAREKATLGFYVSGHPLDRYVKELMRFCNATTETLEQMDRNARVTVGGSVEGFRARRTRTGSTIAFFELEDPSGRVEVIVRPRVLEGVRDLLESGEPIVVTGRVKHEESRGGGDSLETKLVMDSAELLTDTLSKRAKAVALRVDVAAIDKDKLAALRRALEQHPGPVPVSLELVQKGAWAVTLADTGMKVDPTDALRASVERLLGPSAVQLR